MPFRHGARRPVPRVTAEDVEIESRRRREQVEREQAAERRMADAEVATARAERAEEAQSRMNKKLAYAESVRKQITKRTAQLEAERSENAWVTPSATSLQLPSASVDRRRSSSASPRRSRSLELSSAEYDIRPGPPRRSFPQVHRDPFAEAAAGLPPRTQGRRSASPCRAVQTPAVSGAPFALADSAAPRGRLSRRAVAYDRTPFAGGGDDRAKRRGRARSADWAASFASPEPRRDGLQMRQAEAAAERERARCLLEVDCEVRAAEDRRRREAECRKKHDLRRSLDEQVRVKQARMSEERRVELRRGDVNTSVASLASGLLIGAQRTDGWPMPQQRPQGKAHWRDETHVVQQLARERGHAEDGRPLKRRFADRSGVAARDADTLARDKAKQRLPSRGLHEPVPYGDHDGRVLEAVGAVSYHASHRGVRQMPQSFCQSTGAGFTHAHEDISGGRKVPCQYSPRRHAPQGCAPDVTMAHNSPPPPPSGRLRVVVPDAMSFADQRRPAPSPSRCTGRRIVAGQNNHTRLW